RVSRARVSLDRIEPASVATTGLPVLRGCSRGARVRLVVRGPARRRQRNLRVHAAHLRAPADGGRAPARPRPDVAFGRRPDGRAARDLARTARLERPIAARTLSNSRGPRQRPPPRGRATLPAGGDV